MQSQQGFGRGDSHFPVLGFDVSRRVDHIFLWLRHCEHDWGITIASKIKTLQRLIIAHVCFQQEISKDHEFQRLQREDGQRKKRMQRNF